MPFATDSAFATEVGTCYGEYLDSFKSENGQVRVDLFRREDRLEAHVSFPTGLTPGDVTDHYVSDLQTYAREHGFDGRLKIFYS